MSNHEIRFIFQRDIREVLDHFSRLLGIRFCFLSPDGRELQVGEDKPHCRFCRMVREELNLAEKCTESDLLGWRQAADTGREVWYECHAGMVDGCMVVRSGDRIIGYMMIGQFRMKDRCSAILRRRWRTEHGNDGLQKAFLETPRFDTQQVRDIMGVFSVLVDFIVSQRLIAVKGQDPIQPLLAYMDEHPSETLTAREAARLLHRSVSSLSHVFKNTTGKSFLKYQIENKLDAADELFTTRAGVTVREVAMELGFADPYYFSRLYKKHRGRPPSETIQQYAGSGG